MRGVRQGDPLSLILFNAVTRDICSGLKHIWLRRNLGTIVGSSSMVLSTHVMVTDDTTLLASSRRGLTIMIWEVRDSLQQHGLKLNTDKCCVQTSQDGAKLRGFNIDVETIPMVSASQGFKILGTTLTMNGRTSVEVAQQLSCRWAKFHQFKTLLTKHDADPPKRMRLFYMAVTQTVL